MYVLPMIGPFVMFVAEYVHINMTLDCDRFTCDSDQSIGFVFFHSTQPSLLCISLSTVLSSRLCIL